jgi:hypothetical protein
MIGCEHSFVTHEGAQAAPTPFCCHDCGKSFSKMPESDIELVDPGIVRACVTDFIRGATTLAQVAKDTALSLDALNSAIQNLIPKKFITSDLHTTGKAVPTKVVVGVQPHRISCAKEIDDFFSDCDSANLTELQDMMRERFPDVEGYSLGSFNDEAYMNVQFCDGTSQRVKVKWSNRL